AQVGAGEGRAGVETEPTERQNERAENRHRNAVRGHRIDAAVLVVFADAGADEPGEDQPDHTALHVHDRGAGEVHVAVTQAKIDTKLGEPATAPNPVAEDRVHHRTDETTVEAKGRELPSFGA